MFRAQNGDCIYVCEETWVKRTILPAFAASSDVFLSWLGKILSFYESTLFFSISAVCALWQSYNS